VQVDPIKPTLKAPVSKHFKLEHKKLLSKVGFTFNLRRYTLGTLDMVAPSVFTGPLQTPWYKPRGRGSHLSTDQLNLSRFRHKRTP